MHVKRHEPEYIVLAPKGGMKKYYVVFFAALGLFLCLGTMALGERFGVGALFSRFGWISIAEVQVETQWPLTPDVVRSWLPNLKGKNLLLLEIEPLITSLRSKAWVREVSVRKEYPSRLYLSVSTKEPVAIALSGGAAHFIDANGAWIDRMTPALFREQKLPVFSWKLEPGKSGWQLPQMLDALPRIKQKLGTEYEISEVIFESFPLFRVFLSSHRLEIDLTWDEWQTQVDRLLSLLRSPAALPRGVSRINLTIPKKAVVSRPLSN